MENARKQTGGKDKTLAERWRTQWRVQLAKLQQKVIYLFLF